MKTYFVMVFTEEGDILETDLFKLYPVISFTAYKYTQHVCIVLCEKGGLDEPIIDYLNTSMLKSVLQCYQY